MGPVTRVRVLAGIADKSSGCRHPSPVFFRCPGLHFIQAPFLVGHVEFFLQIGHKGWGGKVE